MARVFISSTTQDLKDYREAVYVSLRRLGHESVAVEEWAARAEPPLERCLADIRASDIAVFLVGWRYGYIPPDERYSITELEFRAAREVGIPILVFLVAEDAPWPARYIDDNRDAIRRFRQELLEQYTVSFFSAPDELATQVAVSLYDWVATGTRKISPVPSGEIPPAEAPGPDVFLSYAHEDVDIAQRISERIGLEKLSIFWDRTIPVGFRWDDIVEAALDASKCVVVLWSPAARESEWVRIEATEGAERRILVPALIKQTKIPLRFRQIQAADLLGWEPGVSDTNGMQALISAVRRCIQATNHGSA